jgi:signal transduction histidine kinase
MLTGKAYQEGQRSGIPESGEEATGQLRRAYGLDNVKARLLSVSVGCLVGGLCSGVTAEVQHGIKTDQLLGIRSLSVNGQPTSLHTSQKLRLAPMPGNITFGFGPATNTARAPLRIRYKLDGYDESWREVAGDMSMLVRFIDGSLDPVKEIGFKVQGQTEGWTGALETSAFAHRRETVVAPPGTKGFWIAITSAGPPNTVGIYAITNLVVTRLAASNQPPVILLSWGPDSKGELVGSEWMPTDWMRNGLRVGMAKITQVGTNPNVKALTLLDNDPNAHAEWTTRKEAAMPVSPGDRLVMEWDETYSIGLAGFAEVNYPELPAGFYRFRLNELGLMGTPGEAETSLAFEVPLSFWRTPSFWGLALLLCLSGTAGAYRYVVWKQMRRRLAVLESQRALEHERLRIAQDIHDDLGARVTQISLVSGLAQSDHTLSEKALADFNTISGMARELVSALYETVWAVNPENDNLDALGNYVCQMVDNLCDKAQLRRRLRVAELPRDFQVSSHVRHNLIMAVKEAVHNAIKHAKASELSVYVDWEGTTLTIRVQDGGCGFAPANSATGNGLANMRRRLEHLGGTCMIQSQPGRGTTVSFPVNLKPPG